MISVSLGATAVLSFFVSDRIDAVIIGIILLTSIGLGFGNEYQAERSAAKLHDRIRHSVMATRDGRPVEADVVDLVPGDLVRLRLGGVVPADIRLVEASGLECNEAMITGESVPFARPSNPWRPRTWSPTWATAR